MSIRKNLLAGVLDGMINSIGVNTAHSQLDTTPVYVRGLVFICASDDVPR